MYQSTGKPSIPKFKARVTRIAECASSGRALANRWNPKGCNFVLQRELCSRLRIIEEHAAELQQLLDRR